MKCFCFILLFVLATLFTPATALSSEQGMIDDGGIVTEREIERSMVKGAFVQNQASYNAGSYWLKVAGLAAVSLLLFEFGWRFGKRLNQDRS